MRLGAACQPAACLGTVTKEYDGSYVSNEYPTFESDPARVTASFLGAYFKAPHIWSAVAASSKGLGDRRQRIHPEQVLAHRLYLPLLDWQLRIAVVEAKLDKEQPSREAVRSELDAMLPAILDRAFRGEL